MIKEVPFKPNRHPIAFFVRFIRLFVRLVTMAVVLAPFAC